MIHLFAANIVSLHCLSVTQAARICSLQVGRIRIYIQDTRSLFPNPMTCILLCINVLQNIIMIIMEMGGAP